MSKENKFKELANSIIENLDKIVINYNNYDKSFYNNLITYIDLSVKSITSNNSSFANFMNDDIIRLIIIAIKKAENTPPSRVNTYTATDIKKYVDKKYPQIFDNGLKTMLTYFYNVANDNTSLHVLEELASYSYSYAETIPIDIANRILNAYVKDENTKMSMDALRAAIISIGQNELLKNNITDTTIFFGIEINNSKNRNGYYNNKSRSIFLSNLIASKIDESNTDIVYSLLRSLFHEIEHAIQERNILNYNEISFKKMLFIKEKILRNKDDNFYKNNYENIFMEIYARISSILKTCEYIDCNLDSYNYKLIGSEFYKNYFKQEIEVLRSSMTKKIFNSEKPILDLFDYYMCNISKEKIIKTFKKYPILSLEYNSDGSRKKTTEIFLQIDNRLLKVNSNDNCDKIRIKAKLYSYTQLYIENSLSYIIMDEDNISKMNLQDPLLKTIISSSIEKLYKKEIDNHDEEVRSTRGK